MTPPSGDYIIGVDFGREVNHSAFAVAAVHGHTIAFIHFERIPLHTSYLCVLAKLRRLVKRLGARGAQRITIVCDAAGPGQLAIELIRNWSAAPLVAPVAITAGQTPGYTQSGTATVPRLLLIQNLSQLMKRRLIVVAEAAGNLALWTRELCSARINSGQSEQDDLAIATALTAWYAGKPQKYLHGHQPVANQQDMGFPAG